MPAIPRATLPEVLRAGKKGMTNFACGTVFDEAC